MSIENVVYTSTGKARPVCEFCGKRGRAADPDADGQVHLWQLASGWGVCPYPADFEHPDGSRGDLYQCGACGRRMLAGEALFPHADRRAARAARLADLLKPGEIDR